MCKAYGIPDPGPNDNPTEGRSSALAFAKKAISYFMPNRLMSWNTLVFFLYSTHAIQIQIQSRISNTYLCVISMCYFYRGNLGAHRTQEV